MTVFWNVLIQPVHVYGVVNHFMTFVKILLEIIINNTEFFCLFFVLFLNQLVQKLFAEWLKFSQIKREWTGSYTQCIFFCIYL